ncbi:MAG: hypothetical protein RL264_608 [Bacteroidota bacterium]|jgi:hypothetical protein
MITAKKKNKYSKDNLDGLTNESSFNDKIITIISSMYKEMFIENELNNKIMLDKLIFAANGKELLVENCLDELLLMKREIAD